MTCPKYMHIKNVWLVFIQDMHIHIHIFIHIFWMDGWRQNREEVFHSLHV